MQQKRKKILLVEDSRLTVMIVAEFLNKNGYETETAVTGEEAAQKISGGFPPDLVLMDIELAGEMDGIDAARKIIKSRDIPVVFLTANTSEEIIDKIKELKAYGFVLKGIDKAALLSTVEMALKHHDHSRPQGFDMESFQKLLDQLLSGEQEHILFETVHRRKDGSLYPVEINLQLFDYGGEKLCLAVIADLTEKKQLEEERKRNEERLRLIPEGIPSPAWLVSRKCRILAQNKAAASLFGTKIGDYCWEGIHGGEYLPAEYKEAFEKNGSPLPSTK